MSSLSSSVYDCGTADCLIRYNPCPDHRAAPRTRVTTEMPKDSLPELVPGDLINARYRVVKSLGAGASAPVYQVTQLGLNVDRAMKISAPRWEGVGSSTFEEFRHSFDSEIRFFSSITHR